MTPLPVKRPDSTLAAAITARDFEAVAQWASYFDYENKIHMFTLNSVCRVVEEIGYVLSGERYEEAESVWNVVASIARERGSGALVDEVQAAYETSSLDQTPSA